MAGIGDRIKTVVNSVIDSLLPKFIKDKMKFETEAQKFYEVITESGVKKYVDDYYNRYEENE